MARTARAKLDVGFGYGKYSWAHGEVLGKQHPDLRPCRGDGRLLEAEAGPDAHRGHGHESGPRADRDLPRADDAHGRGGRGTRHPLSRSASIRLSTTWRAIYLCRRRRPYQASRCSAPRGLPRPCTTSSMGLPVGRKTIRRCTVPPVVLVGAVPHHNGCFFQIPYMWGTGAICRAPANASRRFASPTARTSTSINDPGGRGHPSVLRVGAAAGPLPPQRSPFTASELGAELPGNTFYAGRYDFFMASGGSLYGVPGADITSAGGASRWTAPIAARGRVRRRRERCFAGTGTARPSTSTCATDGARCRFAARRATWSATQSLGGTDFTPDRSGSGAGADEVADRGPLVRRQPSPRISTLLTEPYVDQSFVQYLARTRPRPRSARR